jgi:serine/threonine-protein kinase
MGEVYQATDTNLKRQVAIKVLPASMAADAERLARFQREAEVLAALNHPNIAQIHGLEKSDGTIALVMELVEGPTLADRIADGAIPIDEALPIVRQIAEALEAAHEQGIVHRDLKPANVKVRPDGTVKVLDFGLAKAMEPTGAMAPGLSQMPTITTPAMTQAGMILGTAGYMSPEQARGKVVDRRADIWAFGCVLFEMLAGQRAFHGEDVTDTLALVVRGDPAWDALPESVPARVRQALRACLRKDARQRIGDVQSLRLALEGAFETAAPPVAVSLTVAQPAWRRPVPVAATALVIGGLLVALAAWAFMRPAVVTADLIRFVIVPPDDAPMNFLGNRPDLAVSPDGTLVVYRGPAPAGDRPQLNLRPMDQVLGTPLRGADGGVGPFFSPDGAWVGFVDFQGYTTLKKVSTFGGPPVTLTESPAAIYGASWGADDQIVFGTTAGLFRVSGGGGEPEAEALTTVDAEHGENGHRWPFIIPGREAVVFAISAGNALVAGQLALLDLDTREVRRLGLAGVSPHYVSTGHLVYAVEDGSVRAVPFDVASLTVTGNPVPLVEDVVVKASGAANFSVSSNGRLVYALGAGGGGLQRRLNWVGRDGRAEPIAAPAAAYVYPRLSHDGGRVALDARDAGDAGEIWIWDFAQETRTRLIVGDGAARDPVWTPDGTRIAYSRGRVIDWKAANNTGTAERLAEPASEGAGAASPYFFTPDGAALVFRDSAARDTRDDLAMIPVAGGEALWRLTGGFNERNAELSPNGRWMAYESDESGGWQIYVRPFPQVDDDLVTVSNDGGITPLWSRDGRELFYLRPGTPVQLMAVSVDTGGATGAFAVGARTALFDFPYYIGGGGRNYDVAPDGQRFLVIGNAADTIGDEVRPEITVVLNWTSELQRLVPTR